MSFLSPPDPPNPIETSNQQQSYNQQAASAQQRTNMINQNTPYGSLSYTADSSAPGGYSANVNLSPAEQQLLQTQQGTQQTLGTAGNTLAGNVASMYSTAPNIDPSQAVDKAVGMYHQYMDPYFTQQTSNLQSQLQNQGIDQRNAAYGNAIRDLRNQQDNSIGSQISQFEPIAYNQQLQNYQLPLQTISALMGGAAPQGPQFQQTPTAQIQPPNYAGTAQSNYQGQNANYQAMINGLSKVGSGVVGGGWGGGGGISGPSSGIGGAPAGYDANGNYFSGR